MQTMTCKMYMRGWLNKTGYLRVLCTSYALDADSCVKISQYGFTMNGNGGDGYRFQSQPHILSSFSLQWRCVKLYPIFASNLSAGHRRRALSAFQDPAIGRFGQ